jgi:hypothetical protein
MSVRADIANTNSGMRGVMDILCSEMFWQEKSKHATDYEWEAVACLCT